MKIFRVKEKDKQMSVEEIIDKYSKTHYIDITVTDKVTEIFVGTERDVKENQNDR